LGLRKAPSIWGKKRAVTEHEIGERQVEEAILEEIETSLGYRFKCRE